MADDAKHLAGGGSIELEDISAPVDVSAVMDAYGITLEYLVSRLQLELKADITRIATHEGIITDERAFPDWPTRQRARQDAHKLRGDYAPEKHSLQNPDGTALGVIVLPKRDGDA